MVTGLSDDEYEAWNDVYQYLTAYASPPQSGTPGAEYWWLKAADEASRLCQRWRGCPGQELLRLLLAAVYDYLGKKVQDEAVMRNAEFGMRN